MIGLPKALRRAALGCSLVTVIACTTIVDEPRATVSHAASAGGPGELVPTTHGGWTFPDGRAGDWLAGDFDGDGFSDLAEAIVLADGRGAIHVEYGRPDVAGARRRSYVVPFLFPRSAPHRFVAGDVDGDGRGDLVAVHDDGAGHSVLDVLRSSGSGFAHTGTVVGAWPYAANEQWLVGDFDNDGRADIASARDDAGLVSIGVFIAAGEAFAPVAPWLTRQGGWADEVAWVVGDFDNDHRADLASIWNDGGYNTIAMRRSLAPGFTTETWDIRDGGFLSSSRWVGGDFDGDGVADLAVAWNDGGQISIGVFRSFISHFRGSWQYTLRKGSFPAGVPWLAGDFNGDGGIDVVAVDNAALPTVLFRMFANRASSSEFVRLGGQAREVAPMPDGSLWAITAAATAGGNFPLQRRATFAHPGDDAWAPAAGSGVHIEGGPGGPYVTQANGDVVTGSGALLGKRARDVGVAPDGTIWIVSDEPVFGGYRIYRKRPGAAWEDMHAGGFSLDAGPTGAWMVNSAHAIYAYTNGVGWQQIDGAARDVTISPEGTAYVVGTTPRAHGYIAYRRDGAAWTELPGVGIDRIDAGARGEVYGTTLAGVLYALDRSVPVRTFIGPYAMGLGPCQSFHRTNGTWVGWSTFGAVSSSFCSYTWSGAEPRLSEIAALGREQGGMSGADGYALTADPQCSGAGCVRLLGALSVTGAPTSLVCVPEASPDPVGVPLPRSLFFKHYASNVGCSVCGSPMVGLASSGTVYVQLPATAERDAAGNVMLFREETVNGELRYTQVGLVNAPSSSVVIASAAVPDGPLWARSTSSALRAGP